MNIQNSKYHIFELQFCILCEPLTLTTKEVFVTRHIPPVDQVHIIPPHPSLSPCPSVVQTATNIIIVILILATS